MIIIGEKINGSIPSVAKAIAARDADWIRNLAKIQSEAGADFIDVCASVKDGEVETLHWLIDLVQEVTDTPICIDSPNPESCVAAMQFCKRPGMINSVSMEGNKVDVIISHAAPEETMQMFVQTGVISHRYLQEGRLNVFLENVRLTVEHKHYFFGHMHIDKQLFRNQIALFYDAYCLSTGQKVVPKDGPVETSPED